MRAAVAWATGLTAGALVLGAATWWIVDRDSSPSWLFSQTAASGRLAAADGGALTLTLEDVDPFVTAFTDRPARDAEIVPTTDMVESWGALFAGDPPNAVLVEHVPGRETTSVVLTLGAPTWAPEGLVYPVQPVEGNLPEHLVALADDARQAAPAEFGQVSLMIDSSGQPDPAAPSRELSPVERGILQDLGYTVTEPSQEP